METILECIIFFSSGVVVGMICSMILTLIFDNFGKDGYWKYFWFGN